MGYLDIVELGVTAFPITMEGLFPQLTRIMMNIVHTVLKFTQELGGIKAATNLTSMGLTMAQESLLHMVLELVGEVSMDSMIL